MGIEPRKGFIRVKKSKCCPGRLRFAANRGTETVSYCIDKQEAWALHRAMMRILHD